MPRPAVQDILRAFARSPAIRGGSGDRAMIAIRSGELTDLASGRYRVTFFGLDGPHGHATRDTDVAIAEEAREHLESPIAPMSDDDVIAWTSTDEFVKGSKITAFTQAENALRWRAGRLGRYDWARSRIDAANDVGTKHGTVNVRGKPYDPHALDESIADLEHALRDISASFDADDENKENPVRLTYDHFRRMGEQDCANSIDFSEFDVQALKRGTGPSNVVNATWKAWEDEDDLEKRWRDQQDFEGLDSRRAYEAWRDGWKACAVGLLANYAAKRNPGCVPCDNPAPRRWWTGPVPAQAVVCYRTKSDALRKFLDVNSAIVQGYGGVDYAVSPSEFDAINHKHGLTGKRAARTIADAVWAAMPPGRPYCLDRIDLDALNDTSPAREAGTPFVLPDVVYERAMAAGEHAEEIDPGFITEFEPIEPPPPEGYEPYRVRLIEQEPGVAHFQINPARAPLAMRGPFRVTLYHRGERGVSFQRADLRTAMRDAVAELLGTGGDEARVYSSTQLVAEGRLHRSVMQRGDAKYTVRFIPVAVLDDAASAAPVENPPWVTSLLAKHLVELEESVPPQWLPKLTRPRAERGKLTATMKEHGCGSYGCVLPTLDPAVVLKVTTDDTEAQFANELAASLAAPIAVRYRLVRALPEQHKGRPTFLLWRDAADRVGEITDAVKERGGDGRAASSAIGEQHKAAQAAFLALHEGRPADRLLEQWVKATRAMGRIPELRELAIGMIENLHKSSVFMGDVHAGNLGLVGGRWVVVDPGHVAVLE